ncbi:hypothetical protein EVAR_19813_1 [Eumeta japonica]|uniref:Uncharacterized protein n=1 Tax=Eumeta variegata TaxID=151549 RepID=A0A4C1UQQ3_EUMVA|nr:hypothetical protein EVAR_19813_1 [Eumeta japonica]
MLTCLRNHEYKKTLRKRRPVHPLQSNPFDAAPHSESDLLNIRPNIGILVIDVLGDTPFHGQLKDKASGLQKTGRAQLKETVLPN